MASRPTRSIPLRITLLLAPASVPPIQSSPARAFSEAALRLSYTSTHSDMSRPSVRRADSRTETYETVPRSHPLD
ncbi:hypothetical protein BD311DRAFT_142637 [Dichomitus squalens]|uniref:Uncharacterized protein n=1 Tax=Dichomitus squalens TaxID=114155 RepID=A0A4Q9M8N0_9APHY|nr:hypothetical protein BD311DRAFT_142637 [Dichomitus squalens]